MDKLAATVEDVFNRALELPPGAARDHFVSGQCAHNTQLRREVESLLRAHDEAGDFLRAPSEQPDANRSRTATTPLQGTATLNAAAHAEAFLRDAGEGAGGRVEAYLATLPEAVRQEARERIEAGRRVRQLRARTEPQSAEREEPPPQLPGFRIERKLGEGSLGVVYAGPRAGGGDARPDGAGRGGRALDLDPADAPGGAGRVHRAGRCRRVAEAHLAGE